MYEKTKFKVRTYLSLGLLLFNAIVSYGSEDNVVLNTGDKAPFQGILLSIDKAQKLRLMTIDLDTCNKVSSLKDQEIDLGDKRLLNANNEIDTLSKDLANRKTNTFWENIGFFLLGSVLTAGVSYGVVRTLR